MPSPRHSSIVQNAYVVNDVWAAAERMTELMGAGPFYVFEHVPLSECLYRGEPAVLDHTSAYGQCGGVMMELVQQNNDGPSAFRDMYSPGQEGLHHVATFSADIDAEIARYEAVGFAAATVATAEAGTRFAYIDTSAVLGHMTEIYQDEPNLRDFYAMVAAESQNWDGADPIRLLA